MDTRDIDVSLGCTGMMGREPKKKHIYKACTGCKQYRIWKCSLLTSPYRVFGLWVPGLPKVDDPCLKGFSDCALPLLPPGLRLLGSINPGV